MQSYTEEFIRALEDESKYCTQASFKLFGGKLDSQPAADTFVYRFRCEKQPNLSQELTFELQVQNEIHQCTVFGSAKKFLQIAVGRNLAEVIPDAVLRSNQKPCIDRLIERLSSADPAVFTFANQILSGQSTPLRALPTPRYSFDSMMPPNASQIRAIENSFANSLAVIWGPPGTGKTRTIARAVEAHLRAGRRVLLVSHANLAVDAALEDIAEQLETTFYAQSKLLRLSATPNESLLNRFPLLSPGGRRRRFEEGKQEKIDAMKDRLMRLREEELLYVLDFGQSPVRKAFRGLGPGKATREESV